MHPHVEEIRHDTSVMYNVDLTTLREEVNKKHVEMLEILETLQQKRNLLLKDVATIEKAMEILGAENHISEPKLTFRQQVINAIRGNPKTVSQITQETGLEDSVVRGVLYAKESKELIKKYKKPGGRMTFWLGKTSSDETQT